MEVPGVVASCGSTRGLHADRRHKSLNRHATEGFRTRACSHDDGLEIRFKAGGLLEMCWHLFTWDDGVAVIASPELKECYAALLEAALTGRREP